MAIDVVLRVVKTGPPRQGPRPLQALQIRQFHHRRGARGG